MWTGTGTGTGSASNGEPKPADGSDSLSFDLPGGLADLADGGVSPAILPAGGREGGRKGGARRRGPPGSFRDGVMLFCYLDY